MAGFEYTIHQFAPEREEVVNNVYVRPAYAECGGQGDRYKIIVDNRERYLFFEHSTAIGEPVTGRWFVERREG